MFISKYIPGNERVPLTFANVVTGIRLHFREMMLV